MQKNIHFCLPALNLNLISIVGDTEEVEEDSEEEKLESNLSQVQITADIDIETSDSDANMNKASEPKSHVDSDNNNESSAKGDESVLKSSDSNVTTDSQSWYPCLSQDRVSLKKIVEE